MGKSKPAFSHVLGRKSDKNDRVFAAIGSGF